MAKEADWKKILEKQSKENQEAFETWKKENEKLFAKMSKLEKAQIAGFGKLTTAGQEFLNVAKETEKSIKAQVKAGSPLLTLGKSIGSSWQDYNKYIKAGTVLDKQKAKVISGVSDQTRTILGNMLSIGTEEFQSLNLSKDIAKARALGLNIQIEDLKLLKTQQDALNIIHKQVVAQKEAIMKPFEAIDNWVKNIPFIGGMVSAQFNIKGIGEKIQSGFVEGIQAGTQEGLSFSMTDYQKYRKDLKKQGVKYEAGMWEQEKSERMEAVELSGDEAKNAAKRKKLLAGSLVLLGAVSAVWAKIGKYAFDAGLSMEQVAAIGPQLLINSKAVEAFAEEFGTVTELSTGLSWELRKQRFLYGAQEKDVAKIMKLSQGISGATKAVIAEDLEGMYKDARKAGVSPAKLMETMASSADFLGKYVGGSVKEMGKFAIEAAKSGVSLQTLESSMKGALDWENSINKEMEASVLLGRQINLDKFRELSFNQDGKGALAEQVRILRSMGPLDKLRIDQKEMLGELFGVEFSQLSALVREQDKLTSSAQQQDTLWKSITGGSTIALSSIAGAMPGILTASSQMGMIWQSNMGNIKGAGKWLMKFNMIQKIAAALGMKSAAAQVAKTALTAGESVGKTPFIGPVLAIAAIASIAALGWKLLGKSKTEGREKGGPVKSMSPYMVGEKGPELFVPMTSGHIIPHMQDGSGAQLNIGAGELGGKFDTMIALLSKQPTAEQAASNQRDTNRNLQGAFAQR